VVLPHLLAAEAPSASGTGTAATIFAILASAVIVLGGLAALVRAIWKAATIMRDNTLATQQLTERLQEYTKTMDARFDKLSDRVAALEKQGGP
jgi:uncharacterized protein YlxW (UPF0749 family)